MSTPDASSADHLPALRTVLSELMPAVRTDLEALTRIPSVSLSAFDQAHVDASAQAVAALLEAEGLDVRVVREGGRPAVIGHIDGPAGAPTVLLYAHHDVQPPGEDADWDSPPFEPVERDGRLYGRGAADDKAGVMAHVAALRAHRGTLPVGVTVFVEGEEEVGSDSLATILERHGADLRADAIVLADSTNWAVGQPALTTTLRGMIRVFVGVRTLDHGVHSGMFGGPVPDALTTLVGLLATMHDEQGDVAIQGLDREPDPSVAMSADQLRTDAGVLDGVGLIGSGPLSAQLWSRAAITTIGIDAPSVDRSANMLTASARAKVSIRLSPGQDIGAAYRAVERHLRTNVAWGARLEVTLDDEGEGFRADASGPMYDQARAAFADAWGVQPVDVGVGGSIPFVAAFAQRFPDAAILVTGVEDPDTRAHGANESLHLEEFAKVCLAEACLLARLGALSAG